MPRLILHLDLDAFFCAVEEIHTPSLRGQAFAVGGRPEERGVVSSCSYAARQKGVHSAMPMARALSVCPGLIVIPPRRGAYGEMSAAVMARLGDLSPLLEQLSIDEAFLDISDLHEEPLEIARRLQQRVNRELDLPCSIGIAANKLVAKIATEVGKKSARKGVPPNAITIVPAGTEAAFLAPLPAEMLWGVGPKTARQLAALGMHTIGDIAAWPEGDLAARLGEHGHELSRHARGIDARPVSTEHEIKSISQETTFARDVRDGQVLEATLRELALEVGRRLRRSGMMAGTVRLKLRWSDFTTLTRQQSLGNPTDLDDEIHAVALDLLRRARPTDRAVRLIGVGVSSLGAPVRQLELWNGGSEKARRLQTALDVLQEKYGRKAIRRGRSG